jgi:hypothetical protein
MKRIFYKTGLLLFVAAFIFSSCGQRPKVKESKEAAPAAQTGTVEIEIFDAAKLKDQIVEVVKTAPQPGDIVNFINKTGVSYKQELTLAPEDVDKYTTVVEQCLANGIYKFDLFYAKAYNRQDVELKLIDAQEKLLSKVGLTSEEASIKKFNERIKKNRDNADSLNLIVMGMMNDLAQNSASKAEHIGAYALTFISANIEGLYILTQLSLMDKENPILLKAVGQQKERVTSTYKLLEIMAFAPKIEPIFEMMKPIMDSYNANQEFTAQKLSELAPLIEKLRNNIAKKTV